MAWLEGDNIIEYRVQIRLPHPSRQALDFRPENLRRLASRRLSRLVNDAVSFGGSPEAAYEEEKR